MAKEKFEMKGMKKFMTSFNKEIDKLEGRTLAGLINAVIILQRRAEPGTPVDLGNLRSSWFSVTVNGTGITIGEFKGTDAGDLRANHNSVVASAQQAVKTISKKRKPVVLFGYSANYAVFVHENVDATFQRPGAKARWLYEALQSARDEMLTAIQASAKF